MRSIFLGLLVLLVNLVSSSQAATLPSGFNEYVTATGFTSPTAMAIAPDGRIFVCEQGGTVRVIKNNFLLTQPFVSISVNSIGEKGLLGIAFDPNFSTNRYVYLYYTANTPAVHNRISRFTANGDTAVAGSEVVILDLENNVSANHNGGAIHFGADKKLYVAVGDNFNSANAQSFNTLFGKMLRINSDGSIPTDNPFYNTTTGKYRAIWALGLRNPFTFAVQKSTGRIFINDVGQNTWEEINEGKKGANYGWPNSEGNTGCGSYECPLFAYGHGTGETLGCAITGGTFYNPSRQQFPTEYAGDYFFADYCSGWIRSYDPETGEVSTFATGLNVPVDLKVSSAGSLYYLVRGTTTTDGALHRISYSGSQAPAISKQPSDRTVSVGQQAVFSITASGATPLSYQWQRDRVNISGATSPTYTLPEAQLSDNGALFRCVVTNQYGTATSLEAQLTVTSNSAPSPSITKPFSGSFYNAGDTIFYEGDASDSEDGTIPSASFTWQVDFHHADHVHPFLPPTSGSKNGSFAIPNTGETATNVWYRIILTVRDSSGIENSTFTDIQPRTSTITLDSQRTGLQLKLDGVPITTPYSISSVVGMTRTLEAVSPQLIDTTNWSYSSWSDGGLRVHTIQTPSTATTYTAKYNTTVTGDGLTGVYYNNSDFTGTTVSRIDRQVIFEWGTGIPATGISGDTFSVIWTGYAQPRYSETYTFYTVTDDGVRLWVNGQKIIDRWTTTPGESTGSIALIGGQKYTIRMEYYEGAGSARAKLYWSSPSQTKTGIPQSRLYSQ